MMRFLLIFYLLPFLATAQSHEAFIKKIYDEQMTNSPVHENLRYLCKEIGNRLSGSPQAAAAVEYTQIAHMVDQIPEDILTKPILNHSISVPLYASKK